LTLCLPFKAGTLRFRPCPFARPDPLPPCVEGDTLIDLRQQRLANVADGAVFLNGERAVAHIDDGFVVNAFDQKLARIEGGNEREQALIAAGFMLFYAGSS